eukprot:4540287-Prorocentrum_lima.AAC.1
MVTPSDTFEVALGAIQSASASTRIVPNTSTLAPMSNAARVLISIGCTNQTSEPTTLIVLLRCLIAFK